MCSPAFFAASFGVGVLLALGPFESLFGRDMARGERPDLRMMVIATVPDPAQPGAHRVEQVMLSALPKFREKNPGYSLLPPAPKGRVENPLSGMVTEYSTAPSGESVVVETVLRHEMLSVRARYVATRTEATPLYTHAGSAFDALLFGLGLAAVLAIIGRVMKYSIQRRAARGRY